MTLSSHKPEASVWTRGEVQGMATTLWVPQTQNSKFHPFSIHCVYLGAHVKVFEEGTRFSLILNPIPSQGLAEDRQVMKICRHHNIFLLNFTACLYLWVCGWLPQRTIYRKGVSILSYHVGPRAWTQVVRFGNKSIWLLSHLADPFFERSSTCYSDIPTNS